MSAKTEILEIVRVMGPVEAVAVRELCPHIKKQTVYATLNALTINGTIAAVDVGRHGTKRPVKSYSYGGKPCNLKPIKAKQSEAGAAIDLSLARDKIAELEAWKADAILRFPDLAVEPIILTARKFVAGEARKAGDGHSATEIMAGKRDGVLAMKAVIAALENIGISA